MAIMIVFGKGLERITREVQLKTIEWVWKEDAWLLGQMDDIYRVLFIGQGIGEFAAFPQFVAANALDLQTYDKGIFDRYRRGHLVTKSARDQADGREPC
ncbi:hypothetical protein I6F07_23940 [Ensifer sp. IC4062]|nr:hypothetical protein [Ensifer sp. IC4062]